MHKKTILSMALVGFSCTSLQAAAVIFDFADTSGTGSVNNTEGGGSPAVGNVQVASNTTGTANVTIDGLQISLTATSDDLTQLFGSNVQGWGVFASTEAVEVGTTRLNDTRNDTIQFSFDQAVSLDSIRLGSFDTGEVLTIAFVSGSNPFDTDSFITINGTSSTGPSDDLVINGLGTVQAGTILALSIAGGDGSLVNSLNVTSVPEPSSTALLGLGGIALILRRRK